MLAENLAEYLASALPFISVPMTCVSFVSSKKLEKINLVNDCLYRRL